MNASLSPSQTGNADQSVARIQKLQEQLGQLRAHYNSQTEEYNSLSERYNELVDENHQIIDLNNANVDLVKKSSRKIKISREEQQLVTQERDDLEEELVKLKKSHRRKMDAKCKTIRGIVEERDELQIALSRKTHQVEKVRDLLNDRTFEAKQNIATTTRLDKQLGDEAFRKCMDQIFERFRDCFMGVRRKQSFDVKANFSDNGLERFLAKSVPTYKDNTEEEKLHVCISLVSRVLTEFVNKKFVFGVPTKNPILSAWNAWHDLKEGAQNPKSRREIKRWLALTSNILTSSHRDLMVEAREESLELILEDMKKNLETATTLQFTDAIRRRLADAVSPHLTTLRLLHFQDWDYRFVMLPAGRKGHTVRFSWAGMEGLFSEETGFVQASLFPQLCRLEEGDEDEDDRYTIICKARVAVLGTVDEDVEDAKENLEDDEENMEDVEGDSRQSSEAEKRNVKQSSEQTGEVMVKIEDEEEEQEKGEEDNVLDSFDKEDGMDLST